MWALIAAALVLSLVLLLSFESDTLEKLWGNTKPTPTPSTKHASGHKAPATTAPKALTPSSSGFAGRRTDHFVGAQAHAPSMRQCLFESDDGVFNRCTYA